MSVEVRPEQAGALLDHLTFVLDKNKSVNLTAIREEAEGVRLHIVDSLVALPEVDAALPGPMVDIGTGAGYPGIPLAIVSGRKTLLLDSVGKKVAVVDEFVRSAGLDVQIAAKKARAEELERSEHGRYAVVVARAVSELPALVELAAPLLMPDGVFLALKSQPEPAELERGDAVARIVGLKRVSTRTLSLPGGGELRTILAYRRVGRPRVSLPRRTGLAQSKPLA